MNFREVTTPRRPPSYKDAEDGLRPRSAFILTHWAAFCLRRGWTGAGWRRGSNIRTLLCLRVTLLRSRGLPRALRPLQTLLGRWGGGAGPHGFSFLVLRQVENSHFLSQDRGEFLTCTSLSRPLCFPVWGLEPKASETPRLAHCESVPGRGRFQTHPLTRSALKPAAGETGATVLCPCSLPGPLAWLRLSFLTGKMGLVFNKFSVRIAISKRFHLM